MTIKSDLQDIKSLLVRILCELSPPKQTPEYKITPEYEAAVKALYDELARLIGLRIPGVSSSDETSPALCQARVRLERSQQVSDGIKTAFGFLAATLGSAGSKASPIDSVAPGACPSCAPREVCIRVAPASAQKAFRPSSQFDLGLGSTE